MVAARKGLFRAGSKALPASVGTSAGASPGGGSSSGSPQDSQKRARSAGATARCSLAKRVPQIQRTGHQVEDILREAQRDDLVELLNLVNEHPDRITPALQFVQKLGQKSAQVDPSAAEAPKTVEKLDRQEAAAFLAKRGCNSAILDDVYGQDDMVVIQLLSMAIKLPLNLMMPEAFRDDMSAFWSWAEKRCKVVGFIEIICQHLSNRGYDGGQGGPYKFEWVNDRIHKITHVSTEETMNVAGSFNDL